jgi:hypothetical protein
LRHDPKVSAQHFCNGQISRKNIFPVQVESAALRSFHKQKGAKSVRDRAGFDMTEMISIAAQLRAEDMGAGTPMAIAPGTCVLTLDGALPVDHLYPGDRLVTRHGARPVRLYRPRHAGGGHTHRQHRAKRFGRAAGT